MPRTGSTAPSHASPRFADTVPLPNGMPQQVAGGESLFHWQATAAAFADSGGLVSGEQLADLLAQASASNGQPLVYEPLSLVARWIVAQRVVAIDSPWGCMLPMFQFDVPGASVHPGVAVVLAELHGALSNVEMALWFVTPNEWLHGGLPAALMQTRLHTVRDAARADRYVALGG